MKWQQPETAPRDGGVFIADFGIPWPVMACWNKLEQKYAYSFLQTCWVGVNEDLYFESELADVSEMKRWISLDDFWCDK